MQLVNWLQSLKRRIRVSHPTQKSMRRRRGVSDQPRAVATESLEDRALLAAVLHPTTGTLQVDVFDGDTYFDSGDAGGDYINDEDGVITLSSVPETVLQVDFTEFGTEGFEFDFLRVYDGSSTGSPLIGQFQGTQVTSNEDPPGTITATGNELTFEFITDGSLRLQGWEADIHVLPVDLNIPGTAGDDTIAIGLDGSGDLSVTINGAPATIAPFGTGPFDISVLNSLVINAGDGDDTLILDHTNGNPIPAGGLTYNGQGQATAAGDTLGVMGGNFTDVEYTFDNANDGNIDYGDSVLTYTGLEPIIDNSSAVNRIFTFTGGAETITLSDDGTASDGVSLIDSTLGESVAFLNPTGSLTINAGTGNDIIDLLAIDNAAPIPALIVNGDDDDDTINGAAFDAAVFTTVTLNGNAGDDSINLQTLPVTVTASLVGGAGEDFFQVGSALSSMSGILGDVTVAGNANTSGGQTSPGVKGEFNFLDNGDRLTLADSGDVGSYTYALTDTTFERTGTGTVTYGTIESLFLDTSAGAADVDVTSTAASTNTFITTQDVVDTVDIATTGADSNLSVFTNAGADVITIVTTGADGGDADTVGSFTAIIAGADADTVTLQDSGVAARVRTGFLGNPETGNDTIHINATGTDSVTDVNGGMGNDTVNIVASALGGAVCVQGEDNDDHVNVNLTTAAGITAPIIIQGNANDFGAGVGSRDEVEINDIFGGARAATISYPASGAGATLVTGLGSTLSVDSVETIDYDGTGDTDTVTVIGTVANDDLLTVAPISGSRVIVFNGGNPFDGPPELFGASLPGVAGGSVLPDLDIDGLTQTTGIRVDEANANTTTGDKLYVYGQSETGLSDGNTTDPFGFGVGLILPAVAVPESREDISVNDTMTQIVGNNGAGTVLARVNYDAVDFVQADPMVEPGVIVNSGEETTNPTAPPPAADSDVITLSLSTAYRFHVNGGDPDPDTTGVAPPIGDELIIPGTFDVVNVFSNKGIGGAAPSVTIEFPGTGFQGFGFSSIEQLPVFNATTVNLFGDDNNPGVDQNDNFVVVGRDVDGDVTDGGFREFALVINGSSADANGVGLLRFNDVQFLNVFGDDQNPPPGVPSVGPDDIDTLEITPYADDTTRGWGIDVSFDEGLPAGADGDQADLIILHIALLGGAVSEHIEVKPSGPDTGEIVITNSSDGSLILDLDYIANTDIIIIDDDGALNDTDTVTLYGTDGTTPQTSGNETFVTDFDAAGAVATPQVTVTDTNTGTILYRLRSVTGIEQINFNTGDGNDTLNFASPGGQGTFANGVEQLNISGGRGNDTVTYNVEGRDVGHGVGLNFDGGEGVDGLTVSGTPTFPFVSTSYNIGSALGDGQIILNDGFAPNAMIDFQNLEPVALLVPTPTLIVNANNDANAISYSQSPVNPAWGRVAIDGFEVADFGNAVNLTINALGGSDEISLNNPTTPTGLTGVTVNGGDPTASDTLILNGVAGTLGEVYKLAPTAAGAGTITRNGVGAPAVPFSGIEHIDVVLQFNENDQFGVDGTIGNDHVSIASGPQPGRATVNGTMDQNNASGVGPFALPEIMVSGDSLTNGANYNFFGVGGTDTFEITGTNTNDVFNIGSGGATTTIRHAVNGVTTNNFDFNNFAAATVEGLSGDDTFNVSGALPLALTVNGNNPDSGSDVINFTATGNTIVNLGNSTIDDDAVNPPADVTYTGTETVNIIGAGFNLTTIGTVNDDVIEYTPQGVASGKVQANNAAPVVNFSNVGTFTISTLASVGDVVVVNGTNNHDTITVNSPTRTVTVTNAAGTILQPVALNIDVEQVKVEAGLGNDTILVVPGAAVATGPVGAVGTITGGAGYTPTATGASATYPAVPLTGGTGVGATANITVSQGVVTAVQMVSRGTGYAAGDSLSALAANIGGSGAGFSVLVAPRMNLLVDVDGGAPGASDALVIAGAVVGTALPANNFVVHAKGRNPDTGRVRVYAGGLATPDISYTGVEVISPLVAGGPNTPQLLNIGPDNFEENETWPNAAVLGSGETINVENLAIFPDANEHPFVPADTDFFQVVAKDTGTLDFRVTFRTFNPALLPQGGQLEIRLLDSTGTVVAGSNGFFSGPAGTPNACVRIPAVSGETYYLQVLGANPVGPPSGIVANPTVVNGYDLTIINEPPPVPYDIELADIVASGVAGAATGIAAVPVPTVANSYITLPASVAPTPALDATYNSYVGRFFHNVTTGQRVRITGWSPAGGAAQSLPGLAVPAARTLSYATPATGGVRAPLAADAWGIEAISDTGRSQFDDVTRDNTPTIYIRLDDNVLINDVPGNPAPANPNAPDGPIPIRFNDTTTTPPGPSAGGILNSITGTTAGYRVAVFTEGPPQQPGAPEIQIGYAIGVSPGVYTFTSPLLSNGSHFLSARVEMISPATAPVANVTAWGGRSKSLEIAVDVAAPPVAFGTNLGATDGLHPNSDSAVPGVSATLTDRVTNDSTPTFWGTAEANSIVRAYLDVDATGTITAPDILLGQSVAIPTDGTNQAPFGQWEITSSVDLNDPAVVAALPAGSLDGLRTIIISAEDAAGNLALPGFVGAVAGATPQQVLPIFVDTQGPQIFAPAGLQAIQIANAAPQGPVTAINSYNLFTQKSAAGAIAPTPYVNGLAINIRDLPNRAAAFLYNAIQNPATAAPIITPVTSVAPNAGAVAIAAANAAINAIPAGAVALNPADFKVVGDATGAAPILSAYFVPVTVMAGAPATGYVVLTFRSLAAGASLPDDRYSLVISDNLVDPANNKLDGENNGVNALTGNSQPGGAFNAKFTVDSRPEAATFGQGGVFVDINQNWKFDPDNTDATNRDLVFNIGIDTDFIFAGQFSAGAATNGYDRLGAYGLSGGAYRWILDTTDNGVGDTVVAQPTGFAVNGITFTGNGVPFAGNFTGAVTSSDEVAFFDGVNWFLDTNHNNAIDVNDTAFAGTMQGLPFAGDFDGDGLTDLGTHFASTNTFQFDFGNNGLNGVFAPAQNIVYGFSGVLERPVVGDLNADGIDDIGLGVPNQDGLASDSTMSWYVVQSIPAAAAAGTSAAHAHAFSPVPVGVDLFKQFGNNIAVPLLGNFDPPTQDTVTNTAPNLSIPARVGTSASQITAAIAVAVSDADGDAVTTTATADSLAWYLDQTLGLKTNGNLFVDFFGGNEKWIQDSENEWYYITESGGFYKWDHRSGLTGTLVGSFDASFNADPSKLHEAERAALPVEVRVDDGQVTVTRSSDFDQPYVLTVTASDGVDSVEASVMVETVTTAAVRLDQELGLTSKGNYWEDWGGAGEKWIQSTNNSQWYFIKPDGALHVWDGTKAQATGDKVADLDPAFHANPEILWKATEVALDFEYDFSAAGGEFFDWGGRQEKWFRGSNEAWFFILPDGDIVRWDGTTGANGDVIANAGAASHERPKSLYGAVDDVFRDWAALMNF